MKSRMLLSAAAILSMIAASTVASADVTLGDPSPGAAGAMNTWTASGLEAGAPVVFTFGLNAGTFDLRPCPGVSMDISRPIIFGFGIANGDGDASMRRMVPRRASGATVLFQVVAPRSCEVSNLVEFTFE